MLLENRTDVFIAHLPEREVCGAIYPEEKKNEIMAKGCDTARKESFFAWRLLERALKETLGISLEEAELVKKNGRWCARDFDLSISHSGGALAVAISHSPVGVDVEPCIGDDGERIAHRFFNAEELEEYLASDKGKRRDAFLRIWTAKEAIFKSRADAAFAPSGVDSNSQSVYTDTIELCDAEYVISVATEQEVKIYRMSL